MDQRDSPVTPLIVPRSEHPISRKMIDEEALKVLYRLHRHGYLAYLVGGSVRDLLLGKVPKDFDVATNAHPNEINSLFRNSRIIGRRFRLVHIFFKGGKIVEVSTFRSRSEFEEVETEEGEIILSGEARHTISTIVSIEINLPLDDSFFAPEKGGKSK